MLKFVRDCGRIYCGRNSENCGRLTPILHTPSIDERRWEIMKHKIIISVIVFIIVLLLCTTKVH